ncbi:MAG: thioredoxin [Firmicutes bacterium]|nr:thioredoxin [Bacillota bacterium]
MAGNNVVELTDANFADQVTNATGAVLVDFWAPWCGPCRMVAPVVEAVASEYAGKLRVGKLNVDENGTTASKFGIMSIPTLMFFKDGKQVHRIVGFVQKNELKEKIDNLVK